MENEIEIRWKDVDKGLPIREEVPDEVEDCNIQAYFELKYNAEMNSFFFLKDFMEG